MMISSRDLSMAINCRMHIFPCYATHRLYDGSPINHTPGVPLQNLFNFGHNDQVVWHKQ